MTGVALPVRVGKFAYVLTWLVRMLRIKTAGLLAAAADLSIGEGRSIASTRLHLG